MGDMPHTPPLSQLADERSLAPLQLTNHARAQMQARRVRLPEVYEAVVDPSVTVTDAAGVTCYGSNGITVVLDLTMTRVITVLPRGITVARWRGPNEGVQGYRRDPAARRNRTGRRPVRVRVPLPPGGRTSS